MGLLAALETGPLVGDQGGFIQAGGRSSDATSVTGLNSLNWWRAWSGLQNATTVSKGGQPGSAQVTSVTRMAASTGSLKRSRVHSRNRSRAAARSGLVFRDHCIMTVLTGAGPA
jgi:hypothetical protein